MGPSGLSLALNPEVNICRRLLWFVVLVFGLTYSAYNIYENSVRYGLKLNFIIKLIRLNLKNNIKACST